MRAGKTPAASKRAQSVEVEELPAKRVRRGSEGKENLSTGPVGPNSEVPASPGDAKVESPGLSEESEPPASPEDAKVEEPSASPEDAKVEEPPASPEDAKVEEPPASPEDAKVEEQLPLLEDLSQDLPASPVDQKANLRQKFRVDYPDDFYLFWKFCQEQNREHPELALVSTCGLRLVGPYDLISGHLKASNNRKASDFLSHHRYFYDPPEFQTVLASSQSQFHIGYFRHDPKEMPAFVASNDPEAGAHLSLMGDNLFGAVYLHVIQLIQKASEPFQQAALAKLKAALHVYTNMKLQDHDFSLIIRTPQMKARERQKVATTFQGVGLVVPYNRETEVGYRPIPESTASLKKILKRVNEAKNDEERDKAMDVLQELITNVQFANDEGDPGMGIELGLNAFASGGERLHSSIEHLLGVGYALLGRDLFADIIQAHLKKRRAGHVFTIQ